MWVISGLVIDTGLIAASLHVNLEKHAGVNYAPLIGMKRVSKIKGHGAEDACRYGRMQMNGLPREMRLRGF